jgi:hypothetical protein
MRYPSADQRRTSPETSVTAVSDHPFVNIISFVSVLVAEVVKHFAPNIIELHNYSAAHSLVQKTYNWNTLNQKVLKKINFQLLPGDIKDLVEMSPEAVERILFSLREKLNEYMRKKKQRRVVDSSQKSQYHNNSQFAPQSNNMSF